MPARPRRQPARSPRVLRFDSNPLRLPVSPAGVVAARFGDLTTPLGPLPSHAFRVLRPRDLVVLDVLGWDLDLVATNAGAVLVPAGNDARLEVRLPFQHLADRAYYAMEGAEFPPTTQPPEIPINEGDDPLDPPPIAALAAWGSRLVYDVPAGESIGYSSAGVLAAMSRLPLLVAPLATPRSTTSRPPFGRLDDLLIETLPGGLQLLRTSGGLVLREARGRRVRPAGSALDRVLAGAAALRTVRALLAEESAVNLSRIDRRYGDELAGSAAAAWRPGHRAARALRPRRIRPRAPRADETAIEAPYRLIISPSALGGFAHATTPQAAPADPGRVELWHSRLGRPPGRRRRRGDDRRAGRPAAGDPRDLGARQGRRGADRARRPRRSACRSTALDRVILVRQSADPLIAPPRAGRRRAALPVVARRLARPARQLGHRALRRGGRARASSRGTTRRRWAATSSSGSSTPATSSAPATAAPSSR